MPRKTGPSRSARARERTRFNEAAARCRGKPDVGAGDEILLFMLQ